MNFGFKEVGLIVLFLVIIYIAIGIVYVVVVDIFRWISNVWQKLVHINNKYPMFLGFWLIPIGMLLIAVLFSPQEREYYIFLRLIVCATSITFALSEKEAKNKEWFGVFVFNALLYNPITHLRLGRDNWIVINMITIVIYFIHWRKRKKPDSS